MKNKIALAVCLVLAACSQPEPTQTVDWYKDHANERAAVLAQCRSNPGDRELTPNCINVQQAQNELDNARKGLAPLAPLQPQGREN